jgi:hypothetical protein
MGIRFLCPKGHKLNVKRFQAGQTGVCPRCGATMPIPLHSTRRSSRHHRSHGPHTPSESYGVADPLAELETIATRPLVTPIYPHRTVHRGPPRRTQFIVLGALVLVLLLFLAIFLIASRQ